MIFRIPLRSSRQPQATIRGTPRPTSSLPTPHLLTFNDPERGRRAPAAGPDPRSSACGETRGRTLVGGAPRTEPLGGDLPLPALRLPPARRQRALADRTGRRREPPAPCPQRVRPGRAGAGTAAPARGLARDAAPQAGALAATCGTLGVWSLTSCAQETSHAEAGVEGRTRASRITAARTFGSAPSTLAA
jgi:hypothetical protein